MTKHEIVRAVAQQDRATLDLLRTLPAEAFDTPTALPGWRVRDVVGHQISLRKASVTGAILPVAFGTTDRLEAWNERQVPRWSNRSIPDLLDALETWGRRLLTLARAVPTPAYGFVTPTLWGRGPAGYLIWGLAFDAWVHRQDVRRALAMGDEEVDAEDAAEFVLSAIGLDTLRAVPRAAGRVVVSLEGAPIGEWAFDLASRRGGPAGSREADARVSVPAPAFIMASAGRDRFEDLERSGLLRIEGDEVLARDLLSRIRIV